MALNPQRTRRAFKADGPLLVQGTASFAGAINPQAGGTLSGQLAASSGTLSAFDFAGAQTQRGTVTGGRHASGTINAPTISGAATMHAGTLTGGNLSSGTIQAATYTGAQTQSGTVAGGTFSGTPAFSGTPTFTGAQLPHAGTAAPTLTNNGEIGLARVGGTPRVYIRTAGTTYWADFTSGTV